MPYPFKHFRFLFHVLTICRPFMIRPSTTTGSDGLDRDLDCGSNWTPDWIGSDRTGIFAFSAEELFWEKLFFNMTQVARNTKSEFLKLESNLRLVQTRLDYSNRFDSEFFFRAALLIYSREFINRLLWEILTSLSAVFNSGDVTWSSLLLEL